MDAIPQNYLRRNVEQVRDRINRAAASARLDVKQIKLISLYKTFSASDVEFACQTGLENFGENRVQEAVDKMDHKFSRPIQWHLIGHLQSNKAKTAVEHFDWIHSVDSLKLLRRLERTATESGAAPRILIQADLAGEATKHGARIDEIRHICQFANTCKAIVLKGLMIIPPAYKDVELVRPYFERLRQLRDTLIAEGADKNVFTELSMGMSRDFEIAIEEGATMVRVGTAIFGNRTSRHLQQRR